MKKSFGILKGAIILAAALALSACGALVSGSSYETGVNANKKGNTEFNNLQMEQQISLQVCFMYSKNTSECAILAAGTNATQVLAGRPAAIKIASSPEEIMQSVLSTSFDAAVKIYGLKAVSDVVKTGIAESGKTLVVKPEVVRPEVVQPVIVHSPAPAAAVTPAVTTTPAL